MFNINISHYERVTMSFFVTLPSIACLYFGGTTPVVGSNDFLSFYLSHAKAVWATETKLFGNKFTV